MGNIVNLRTRLEALEQRRTNTHHIETKAERDARVHAHLSGSHAEEQAALAAVAPGEMHANRVAAIRASFRNSRDRHDGNDPTPPNAA